MPTTWDHGPVYYREIQKNAYLKRIPDEGNSSKLRPLGHKKPPLKAMWTLFCIHNGKIPFLEQYPSAESPAALSHAPVWAASLQRARHVTASVKPRAQQQYDFLVDTDHGPIRMLAPDWESMADWVGTLRRKLQELKVLSAGVNVYSAPAAPPAPRAGTRDPTSPLPPTPPAPTVRIPGIEIPPAVRTSPIPEHPETSLVPTPASTSLYVNTHTTHSTSHPNSTPNPVTTPNSVIATTSAVSASPLTLSSTSQPILTTPKSITATPQSFSSTIPVTTSLASEEPIDISNWDYPSIPSTSGGEREKEKDREREKKAETKNSVTKISGQSICLDDSILKRNVVESEEELFDERKSCSGSFSSLQETFKEGFKQRFLVSDGEGNDEENSKSDFKSTNITVIQVSNRAPPHTAIPVMGPETEVFNFDFTQNLKVESENTEKPTVSDNFVNIVNTEVNVQSSNENSYGTVFSDAESDYGHLSLTTTVNLTPVSLAPVSLTPVSLTSVNDSGRQNDEGIYERMCMASTSNVDRSPLVLRKVKNADRTRKSSLPNLDVASESTYEYLFLNSSENNNSRVNAVNQTQNGGAEVAATQDGRPDVTRSQNGRPSITEINSNSNVHVNLTSSISIGGNVSPNTRVLRANLERSHSQNAYDSSPRREGRRAQHNSPKRDNKSEKTEQNHKPIWKRGLTELSLLSRLRGIGQKKDEGQVAKHEADEVKVARRSRADAVDSRRDGRRRSTSLSNGGGGPALQPLLVVAAAWLRAEQRRGASVARLHAAHQLPILAADLQQVWIALWPASGARSGGRSGDKLLAVRGIPVKDVSHAKQLFKTSPSPVVDVLFHKVPLAKIYVLHKRDNEPLGIKLDNECNIVEVAGESCAGRAGLPAAGAVTQVNDRHINLIKGGEEEMLRISRHGTEVSLLVQPSHLVKKLRAALKANKSFLHLK